MKILVVEANNPEDFYRERLDGRGVHTLLDAMQVKSELRMVLRPKYLRAAIIRAARDFDVLHLSCHGDEDGISIVDADLSWEEFVDLFRDTPHDLPALVLSSCCGASSDITRAFATSAKRPRIIFGSTEALTYGDYCVAWAILYNRFRTNGVSRDSARQAMKQINAVVHQSFVYRRWDEQTKRYLKYPRSGEKYEVAKVRQSR